MGYYRIILKINIFFILIISFLNIIYISNNKKNKMDFYSSFIRLNFSKIFNNIFSILYDLSRSNRLKIEFKKNYAGKKYIL